MKLPFQLITKQAINFRFSVSIFPILVLLLIQPGCGGDSDTRSNTISVCNSFKIINGEPCNQQLGPVVKLTTLDEEDNPKICSALMISPTTAITAWHCFDEFVFSAYVTIGEEKRAVGNFYLNPLAEVLPNGVVKNDLAVFEIEEGDTVPNFITNISKRLLNVGDVIEVYGFGRFDSETSSGVLRKGKMTISSIDNNFIRAKYDGTGQNTCYGDSGGPAFLVNGDDLELVGILSSGTNYSCLAGDESYFVNLQSPESQTFLAEYLHGL